MPGLLADGWFYISSAGLLVSGALFFFLLGQYRAAADAADDAHGEDAVVAEGAAPTPVRPLYIPDEPEPVKSAPLPVAAQPPASSADKKDSITGATLTGGVSPAMGYLQNLKTQLEDMGVELRGLTKKVAAISERDEALIERLGDLTRAVEELKPGVSVAAAPAETLTPKKARKPAEPKPETVVSVPTPAAVEFAEPAPAPEELRIELGTALGAGAPVSAPEPEPAPKFSRAAAAAEATLSGGEVQPVVAAPAAEPAAALDPAPVVASVETPAETPAESPAEEKPRRGPVWPV